MKAITSPSPDDSRSEAARLMGKAGGKARALALTPAHRLAISRKAAAARWGKQNKKPAKSTTITNQKP